MPSVVNPANIYFDAPQYPIDNIVGIFEGSFALTAFNGGTFTPGTGSTTVTHNIGTKCISEMIWSTNNTNFYDGGLENSSLIGVTQACDTNTCTLYAYNGAVGAQTIYYKLYLVWPT